MTPRRAARLALQPRSRSALLCTGALCLLLGLHAAAADVQAEDYETLKRRLVAGEAGIDFRALRMAYAATPAYTPNSAETLTIRKQAQEALESGKFQEARAIAERWLEFDYLNPFAHMGAAKSYRELGDTVRANFHAGVLDGLYKSICREDEGRSEKTPCRVLSIDEAHFYLGMNDLVLDGQWGTLCAGDKPCEVYAVTARKSKHASRLYFDISLPYAYQQAHAKP